MVIHKKKILKDEDSNEFKVTPIEEEAPESFGVQPSPLSDVKKCDEDDEEDLDGRADEAEDDSEGAVAPIRQSDIHGVRGEANKIAITFDKFIQLMTSHNFEDVIRGHEKKEIILDIDLFADLASAHTEEEPDKRVPTFFILGLFIGAVVVFILVKFFS